MEKQLAEHREQLLAGLAGRVVEVGAGNGMNFRHYPASVDEVVALEPEAYLRERAEEAALGAAVAISVGGATAEALPFDDKSFDAAVACLVLCTVPDPVGALPELRRVLKRGAELRFLEHVRSGDGARLAHKSCSTARGSGPGSRAAVTAHGTRSRRPSRPAFGSTGCESSTSARRGS